MRQHGGPSSSTPTGPSIVIPARNAEDTIESCLRSCLGQDEPPLEIVLVDDASSDGTAGKAEALGATVLRHEARRGVGAARNEGARAARSAVLLFVDADCLLAADVVRRVRERMAAEDDLVGLVGAYTPDTPAKSVLSAFKNLQHHWVHHRNAGPISTFWGACGAMRRDALVAAGGFVEAHPEQVLEDVELGYRVTAAGGRIVLDPSLVVTHLHRYGLLELIRSELWRRAVPWSRTLLERGERRRDLNLRGFGRLKVALTGGALVAAPLGFLAWPAWIVAGTLLGLAVALDGPFLAFARRRRGIAFAAASAGLLVLHDVLCGLGFVLAATQHLLGGKRDLRCPGSGFFGAPPT